MTIVAGFLESAEDRVYNTVAVFTESGIAGSYRKVHLYDAFGAMESDAITAGDPQAPPAVFEVNGWRIGLQTCYDLRFPEVSRNLIDGGAEVLVVPSDWVPGDLKVEHWKTLLGARAIENTCWLVAADHSNPSGIGYSAVVSPAGIFAELAGSGAATLSHVLDRTELEMVRKTNPALANRRFRVSPV
jgi:predicted amidohydrolase